MILLKILTIMTFLFLSVGCGSNPTVPALPLPDCPRYHEITDEEVAFLNEFCKDDMDVCPIYRLTIIKISMNHAESVQCIEQYRAIIESTRE